MQNMKRAAAAVSPVSATVKAKKPRKAPEPFWTDSIKPEYYFEGGLRKVKPYYYEYRTFAKQRWYGRTLLDVFQKEFRDRTLEYYGLAMKSGLVTVNGLSVEPEYVVENGDQICHRIHRHEPPVTGKEIKILFKDERMLVVDKPASVPVHPSGRYRFNSLIEILRADHGFSHLSVINRLDRLTSGIVMLGLNPDHSSELHKRMEAREYQKTYVCRVIGRFPEEPISCHAPLKAIEHKLGFVGVSSDGKEARTDFKLLAYDKGKDESLVEAKPLTGRTHQIRVHLQALGHPIVNDHLYNNPAWQTVKPISDSALPYKSYSDETLQSLAETLLKTTFYDELPFLDHDSQKEIDPSSLCPECDQPREDPKPEQLCIYLHAKKYSCEDFEYEADLPPWAHLGAE